jgi:prolyl-tRNA synthetase
MDGDVSPDGKSKLRIRRAIEVGHIFKLGTMYAEALGAKFLDKNGEEKTIIMGSYGMGIERIAAAYIEQNHDENGIIWDGEIAPFRLHLICVNPRQENIKLAADNLYDLLVNMGYEVLYDDREDISPGFKFKDADLIGIPAQLIVSEKNMKNNEVELKFRRSGKRERTKLMDIKNSLPIILKKT